MADDDGHVPSATRADIREAARKLDEYRAIPPEQFPGHKGIACANLEGWLGRYAVRLLDALEELERRCRCPVGFGAAPDPNCPKHGSRHG